jgi:hypothetical protein
VTGSTRRSDVAPMALTPEQRRKNVRLGLALFTVALVFGLGFIAKAIYFGL